MTNCYDENCELKGNFEDFIILNYDNIVRILKKHEKSVDSIVFAKRVENKKVNVLLCELTTEKIGRYEEEKRIKKTNKFSIAGCSRNDLKIYQDKCSTDIGNIEGLHLLIS